MGKKISIGLLLLLLLVGCSTKAAITPEMEVEGVLQSYLKALEDHDTTALVDLSDDLRFPDKIVLERRSVKVYDPEVKISREEMREILTKASRAPSAINMQPWRFLVIDSAEGKEKLASLATFNRTKVLTSSAVVAVFYDANNVEYMDEIYGKAVELGYMPKDIKDMQLQQAKPYYASLAASDLRDVNLIDSGLFFDAADACSPCSWI